jgi:hypothetical protein
VRAGQAPGRGRSGRPTGLLGRPGRHSAAS